VKSGYTPADKKVSLFALDRGISMEILKYEILAIATEISCFNTLI
jgi:hypothetical protein